MDIKVILIWYKSNIDTEDKCQETLQSLIKEEGQDYIPCGHCGDDEKIAIEIDVDLTRREKDGIYRIETTWKCGMCGTILIKRR